jgi:hypothetical protein
MGCRRRAAILSTLRFCLGGVGRNLRHLAGDIAEFYGKRRHQSRTGGNDMGWQSGPGNDAEWRHVCLRSGELFSSFSDEDSQRISTLRISDQHAGRPRLLQSGLQHWRRRTSHPRYSEWSRKTDEGLGAGSSVEPRKTRRDGQISTVAGARLTGRTQFAHRSHTGIERSLP